MVLDANKLITVIICFILCIAAKKYTKTWLNPLSMFSGIWSIILFLSTLGLHGLKTASCNTYYVICAGVTCFAVGYLLTYKSRYSFTFNKSYKHAGNEYVLRYQVIYILGIICIIYFAIKFLSVASIFFSGNGLAAIRVMAQSEEAATTGGGKFLNAVRILLVMPYAYAIIPITAMEIWFGRKDKKVLFICLSIIALRVLSEGGRISVVYFALHLLIGFSLLESYAMRIHDLSKRIRKNRKKLRIGVLVLVVIVLLASMSRSMNSLSTVTYYYFSMQPYMQEIWSKAVDEAHIIGYGVGSFNGLIFPILYLLKNILGIPFTTHFRQVYDMILETDSQWQIISSYYTRANAYVGTFWYFYLDGKVFGIILLSLIYGIMGGRLYSKAKRHTNIKNACLYSFYMQSIALSFSGFAFSSMYYGLAFLFIIFIAYKKRGKE